MHHDEIKKLEKEREKVPVWTQTQYNQLLTSTKYEYEANELPIHYNLNEIDILLNKYGKDGWELVNVVNSDPSYIFFFKRPIKESENIHHCENCSK